MTNNEAVSYLIEAYSFCATRFCSSVEDREMWRDKLTKFREAIAYVSANLNTNFIKWRDYTWSDNNGDPMRPPYIIDCDSSRGISKNE